MTEKMTLRAVLGQLAGEGHALPENYEETAGQIRREKQEAGSPWYLRLFSGISAWIAAILLIIFIFSELLSNEAAGLIAGLFLCGVAIAINRLASANAFTGQFALALSLTGQGLFGVGLGTILDNLTLTLVFLIILELVLIFAMEDGIHRVFSVLVIAGSLLAILFEQDIIEMIHLLNVVLAGGVLFLTLRADSGKEWLENTIRPAGYGVVLSLLGLLILPLLGEFEVQYWWITAALLCALLIFLVTRITADLGVGMLQGITPWLLGGCLLLLVPAIRMPGLLAALLVMLAGFWRSNRLHLWTAIVFLVFYLWAYYYSLEWTLLLKSIGLAATGSVLFLLRFVLMKFSPEDTHENA